MTSVAEFILRFYGPLVTSIVLCGVAFLVRRSEDDRRPGLDIVIPLGFLLITVPLPSFLRKVLILRLSLLGLATAFLGLAVGTDFSRFFPDRLRMDVFYDEEGIKDSLAAFSQDELGAVGVDPEWRTAQLEYYNEVAKSIAALGQEVNGSGKDMVAVLREASHARGETTFKLERVGPFSYVIVESRGHLDHVVDMAGRKEVRFRTSFELRESPYNHVRPGWRQLFLRHEIVVRPEFRQVLAPEGYSGEQVPIHHVVIGMTKVQLLLIPEFGNTVYLWKRPLGGAVPVAYAVYF